MKKSILITGASSGIGAALAKAYACEENILFLTGRNHERLQKVADECIKLGAIVQIKVLDVTDRENMKIWIENILSKQDLTMVIANAGVSTAKFKDVSDENQIRNVFDINVNGVFNTILPIIPYFEKRKSGHIVIMSSLAGFKGLASCPAYSASKAAVKIFGEGLRGALATSNIAVTVITPGFINTPLVKLNDFKMPFLMNVDKAVYIIKNKLEKRPARIAFPFLLYFIVWLMSILPPGFSDWLFDKFAKKRK